MTNAIFLRAAATPLGGESSEGQRLVRSLIEQVVVVTGAGRGIGREIALLAAAEGAHVVVNDLGGSANGVGADMSPARDVVDEILASGGAAVASTDDVSEERGAANIIRTGLDAFGRIDVVVNNAGILRDKIFHQMTADDFDRVVRVHLYGSFYVARAAATEFRQQESGTYVHFTSASGLIGNFGQANYMAAKLGVVGLSKAIALDMARFHVRSNCIAPFAWSRLTETIPSAEPEDATRVQWLKTAGSDKVASLAVFLASQLSGGITGQIFGVRGQEIFLFNQSRPIGTIHRDEAWSPQALAEHLPQAFGELFVPLDRSDDVFSWEPR